MKCEDAIGLLADAVGEAETAGHRSAYRHLEECEHCASAWRAVQALREEGSRPVPGPDSGLFARTMRLAAQSAPRAARRRRLRGFWLGAGVGALAAGAAFLMMTGVVPALRTPPPEATPHVRVALNQPRDVSIALDSSQRLADVRIRVVLSGAIDLVGFGSQREISWTTDLERGTNKLTLPVVALGTGQLLVEVGQGERRRTFVLDVLPTNGEDVVG
jgi:hypothetical protein